MKRSLIVRHTTYDDTDELRHRGGFGRRAKDIFAEPKVAVAIVASSRNKISLAWRIWSGQSASKSDHVEVGDWNLQD